MGTSPTLPARGGHGNTSNTPEPSQVHIFVLKVKKSHQSSAGVVVNFTRVKNKTHLSLRRCRSTFLTSVVNRVVECGVRSSGNVTPLTRLSLDSVFFFFLAISSLLCRHRAKGSKACGKICSKKFWTKRVVKCVVRNSRRWSLLPPS